MNTLRMRPVFLPAYSPQPSPIEVVFSLIKGKYRKRKIEEAELRMVVPKEMTIE